MQQGMYVRVRAFLYSLAATSVACIVFALITQHYWYPGPLFWVDGGVQGVRSILALQVVLGPLLAAYLVHPQKTLRKIKIDIAVVGSLQILIFCIGGNAIYSQRPVAVAFYGGAFHTISASAITPQEQTLKMLERFGNNFPVWIYPNQENIDSVSTNEIFSANQRWDEIKLATSDAIPRIKEAAGAEYFQALNGFQIKQNIIILSGRYKTVLANVDNNFEVIESRTLLTSGFN